MAIELETRVALLEKGHDSLSGLLDRFDTTIDKLSEVSNFIKQLLAVHEVQLKKHDDADEEIYRLIESRRDEMVSQHNITQNKFEDFQDNVKRTIKDTEDKLMDEFKSIKKEMHTKHEEAESRTRELERWKWIAVGAIGVVFFLASKTNIFSFFHL